MTKFNDLNAQYHTWKADLKKQEANALRVMIGFCNKFRFYLGLDPAFDQAVKFCKIISDDAGIDCKEVVRSSEALTKEEDGSWRFGLSVTLREGIESITFFLYLSFTINNNECVFTNLKDNTKTFLGKFIDSGNT